MSCLQINYTLRMMFYDVNDVVMIIKQAFSIKFINNDLSAAWESRDRVWKDDTLLLKRLNKYNYIYIQWWDLCCCLFYTTTLFRMYISSLLCKHFVNKFILRCLHFLCLIFFFITFCFCISFQQNKYVNSITYSTYCVLNWLSSYRFNFQNWFW